ncbi:hypothetical protein KAM338_45760 [Aeromonas caviae]|nr:hypothetical protein KAM338_45760 [Aeromonas caviae]
MDLGIDLGIDLGTTNRGTQTNKSRVSPIVPLCGFDPIGPDTFSRLGL